MGFDASPTVTALTAAPNPAYQGQTVTLTANVSDGTSAPPAGTIAFLDGTSTLGAATLGASGTASYTTSSLAVGTHTLSAAFTPSASFLASSSPPVQEVILPSAFTIAVVPTILTISAGQSGTAAIQLASVGNFAGPLALTAGTLPAYASAAITPAAVTLAAGGNGSATLLLTTEAVVANTIPARPGSREWPIGIAAALVLLMPRRQRKLLAVMLAACLLSLTGCTNAWFQVGVAAPGTYQLPITATDTNHNSRTAVLTVVIQ